MASDLLLAPETRAISSHSSVQTNEQLRNRSPATFPRQLRALQVTVQLNPQKFFTSTTPSSPNMRIIIYLNGCLASSSFMPAHEYWCHETQGSISFTGTRIGDGHVSPWVINLSESQQVAMKISNAASRWSKISNLIRHESRQLKKDANGNASPTSQYLKDLSRLGCPKEIALLQDIGCLDVFVVLGRGERYTDAPTPRPKRPERIFNRPFGSGVTSEAPADTDHNQSPSSSSKQAPGVPSGQPRRVKLVLNPPKPLITTEENPQPPELRSGKPETDTINPTGETQPNLYAHRHPPNLRAPKDENDVSTSLGLETPRDTVFRSPSLSSPSIGRLQPRRRTTFDHRRLYLNNNLISTLDGPAWDTTRSTSSPTSSRTTGGSIQTVTMPSQGQRQNPFIQQMVRNPPRVAQTVAPVQNLKSNTLPPPKPKPKATTNPVQTPLSTVPPANISPLAPPVPSITISPPISKSSSISSLSSVVGHAPDGIVGPTFPTQIGWFQETEVLFGTRYIFGRELRANGGEKIDRADEVEMDVDGSGSASGTKADMDADMQIGE